MPKIPPPSPPYVGPAAHDSGGGNKPIHRIVIHSTVSPCQPGMARRIAAYFRSSEARGSAHYIVDPAEIVQSVFDGVIAWHAPPNANSIGVELCDYPTTANMRRWADANHKAMFNHAARLVAQLCLAYDVPMVYRDFRGLRKGLRGITTHNAVSAAWGQSTHWDPGAWPRRRFIRAVRRQAARIRKEYR